MFIIDFHLFYYFIFHLSIVCYVNEKFSQNTADSEMYANLIYANIHEFGASQI